MSATSWIKASKTELKLIQGVCLDIDDTLSTKGKLEPDAYEALWDLRNAGFFVVPVTGRPAGWCDHIARFWPVNAVVGENGAFVFYMEKGVRHRINTPAGIRHDSAKYKLEVLARKVRRRFPHARWASDQAYRENDLAIDFCEDVKPWPKKDVQALVDLCHTSGAHAKISSIHVNAWFGEYDKLSGFNHWWACGAPGILKKPRGNPLRNWLFIGDSPNDEPMMAAFNNSVGVANIKPFLKQMKHTPRWITTHASGKGFCEMVRRLVA